METQNWMGLMEVARLTGISYWRIIYAHKAGALPWPAKVVNTWAYSPEDVQRVKDYFAAKKRRSRKVA
jgi:predicted site-specific integrase-resolvase